MLVCGYASRALPNLVSTAVAVPRVATFLDTPRHRKSAVWVLVGCARFQSEREGVSSTHWH
jgi:hypothetical protein